MKENLTSSEYAILGLLVEKPCHGYDLEQLIDERGMREWTELAFSSIYYVLKRLEKYGLVEVHKSKGGARTAKKVYRPTSTGYQTQAQTTLAFLGEPRPTFPPILLGLANWPSVENHRGCEALRKRKSQLQDTLEELIQKNQNLPDFVSAMFDFSVTQIGSELEWLDETIEKLEK